MINTTSRITTSVPTPMVTANLHYFRCSASFALSISSSALSSTLSTNLFNLVPRVADLLLGFTCMTIGLAFGFEILVAGEASDGLFDLTLHLISLSSHGVPPSLEATTGSAMSILPVCADVSGLARDESHLVEPEGRYDNGESRSVPDAWLYVRKITAADRNASPAQINVAHTVLSMKDLIPAMMNRIAAIRAKT